MTKTALRLLAYREAAAWLGVDVDRNDLDNELEEAESDEVRRVIRDEIVPMLSQKGGLR